MVKLENSTELDKKMEYCFVRTSATLPELAANALRAANMRLKSGDTRLDVAEERCLSSHYALQSVSPTITRLKPNAIPFSAFSGDPNMEIFCILSSWLAFAPGRFFDVKVVGFRLTKTSLQYIQGRQLAKGARSQ